MVLTGLATSSDSSAGDVVSLAQSIASLSTPALLALIVLAFAGNWIYTRRAYERERARADALQTFVTDEMVPALTRATDALRDSADDARRRAR